MTAKAPTRAWFAATRDHGRFTAVPIRWEGWASLLAFVILIALGGTLLMIESMEQFGTLAIAFYLPIFGLAFWAFIRFVMSKSDVTDLRS